MYVVVMFEPMLSDEESSLRNEVFGPFESAETALAWTKRMAPRIANRIWNITNLTNPSIVMMIDPSVN